jgi:hypothetical protein
MIQISEKGTFKSSPVRLARARKCKKRVGMPFFRRSLSAVWQGKDFFCAAEIKEGSSLKHGKGKSDLG